MSDKTFQEATDLIARRAPVMLDTPGEKGLTFGDDHEFVVQLPAWALRAIRARVLDRDHPDVAAKTQTARTS